MEHMLHEIKPLVSNYGLFVIFFGMMVEGTVMILVSGILCYLGLLSLTETIFVAIIGAIIGDQIWYWLGHKYMVKIIKIFPSLISKVDKFSSTVDKRGTLLALSGRFIYGGAILFPLILGHYAYSYKKFILYDTTGVSIWALLGILLGYLFGTGIEKYFGEIKKIEDVIFVVIGIYVVVWFVKKIVRFKN